MAKFEEASVAIPNQMAWVSSKDKTKTENYSVFFTRFPFESQLGGEELHTIDIAKFYRQKKALVGFIGSCKILLRLFDDNQLQTQSKWLYKPPVDMFSLVVFTLLFPFLFLKSGFDILKLKITYGMGLRLYMLGFTEKLVWAPWCWLFGVNCIWLEHARFGKWFHKNPWKIWYKFWSNRSNVTVVTVSELMKKEAKLDHIEVIPNAIDGGKFSKIKDASSLPIEVRRAFAKKKFDIGFVGRFSEDKGIDIIIEASKKFPDVGFICCGKGKLKTKLDKNNIDNFWLTPELIPCFMQNIDLLILPATKTDPFGLVVLESMHASTPVLLTDKCGVAHHLRDKKNAFVCSPDDFIERLEEIINKPEMIKKVSGNLVKSLEQFDYLDMKNKYWDLLS